MVTDLLQELLSLAKWIENTFQLAAGAKVHATRESERIYHEIRVRLAQFSEGADSAPPTDLDYCHVTSQEMLDDLRELREWRQGVRRVAPFSEGADPVPPSREAHILAHISYYTPH